MKTIQLNRLAVLAGTLFTLAAAGSAHAFGNFSSTVQSQCDRLGQPIAASVNINDCATCHGNPFSGQNSGNMYWFAYTMSDWGQFCPVTVSAPPVTAGTGTTGGSTGATGGATGGSASTGGYAGGGTTASDDDWAGGVVADDDGDDMDERGGMATATGGATDDDNDGDRTRRFRASRDGDTDDDGGRTRLRTRRGDDADDDGGAGATRAERGITRSTEMRAMERPSGRDSEHGGKRRGRGDDSEG